MIGETIIPTHAKRGHIEVDACVLWCVDPRFRKALWDFEKARGFKYIDVLKNAGGGKALAGTGPCKKAVLADIRASVTLHNPKLIVPMFHTECGAYRGTNFGRHSEEDFLRIEAHKATETLLPLGLPIQPVIVDFDKIIVLEKVVPESAIHNSPFRHIARA